MFFEIFEDLRFLKIFDPQDQIFKNRPRIVEISAHLKSNKNGENRYKRCFWDFGAYFLTHFGFCMNLGLKFHHVFLVKNALPRQNFDPFGGFLGVGEVGQLHFWKPLGWVLIHPKSCWSTPIQSNILVTQNCYPKHFRFPCQIISGESVALKTKKGVNPIFKIVHYLTFNSSNFFSFGPNPKPQSWRSIGQQIAIWLILEVPGRKIGQKFL